jgi:uncharacterized protein
MQRDEFREGLALFDRGKFYDAHEVLEDVWRVAAGEEKLFLQGLIQAAVALHHHSTGNTRGACSLLERAIRNLGSDEGSFTIPEKPEFVAALRACREAVLQGNSLPALPRLGNSAMLE